MYVIKINDKVNKSERVIFKQVSLDTYEKYYTDIYNKLNSNNDLSFTHSSGFFTIYKCKDTKIKGYLYNTTAVINTILYELSLVKIDEHLRFTNDTSCQTMDTEDPEDAETEQDIDTVEIEHQFGKFQEQFSKVTYKYQNCFQNACYPEQMFKVPFYTEPLKLQKTTIPIYASAQGTRWAPELINELKMKLSLPNSGLTSICNLI